MTDSSINAMSEAPKIEFPCDYPIKVIVEMGPDIIEQILAIIKKFDSSINVHKVKLKPSEKGNYLSIRYQFQATGREQLQRMFDALKNNISVRMVL